VWSCNTNFLHARANKENRSQWQQTVQASISRAFRREQRWTPFLGLKRARVKEDEIYRQTKWGARKDAKTPPFLDQNETCKSETEEQESEKRKRTRTKKVVPNPSGRSRGLRTFHSRANNSDNKVYDARAGRRKTKWMRTSVLLCIPPRNL
jgi:hypothetical protein